MSLSDTAVRLAKKKSNQFKLSDDLGLYVLVKPSGSKLWRMDYQFAGKRNTLSFGQYPSVTLAEARQKRDEARNTIARGEDPKIVRKLKKIADQASARATFQVVAKEYIEKLKDEGRAEQTISKHEWLLLDLASELKDRPIADIQPLEILSVLQRVEKKGKRESATRLRGAMGRVFRLAVATVRATRDPTLDLKGAIAAPVVKSYAAITDENQFGAMMLSIDEHDGWPTVRYALQFIALVACRPGEVRLAKWPEFDLVKRTWTIPKERMKARREHIVPLSDQAVRVIEQVKSITDIDEYVFNSLRTGKKPLSENAMNSALKRMGYSTNDHVSHGFRSSFSTIMNNRRYDGEIIEAALAHRDTSVRGIYNRAKYWNPRVELMQTWADLVDEMKGGKKVVAPVVEFEELL